MRNDRRLISMARLCVRNEPRDDLERRLIPSESKITRRTEPLSNDYYAYIWRDPEPTRPGGKFHRVRYVGAGSGNRASTLAPSCRNLPTRTWLAELKAQGKRPRVEVLWSGLDQPTAYGYEVALIDFYRASSWAGDLLNIAGGGPGNVNIAPETRAKLRAFARTEVARSLVSESNRRRAGEKRPPRSAEHRAALSTSLKGNGLGRKHSVETIAKIRAGNIGRKLTPETIERMRQAQQARRDRERVGTSGPQKIA